MTKETKATILNLVLGLLATTDPQQISMRQVAYMAGVQQSVIYHHYPNKDALLKAAFMSAQQQIRQALIQLPPVTNVHQLMHQRIVYHLDNSHLIVPMLRYFMAFKLERPDEPGGFIPPQAYMHIKQVIEKGIADGIYDSPDPDNDAKVIVHAINGFILEHFPDTAVVHDELVQNIESFVERALRKEGVQHSNV